MAAVGNMAGDMSNEKLHGILQNIGAPMIELAFFADDKVERLKEQLVDRLPQKIINSLDEVEQAEKLKYGEVSQKEWQERERQFLNDLAELEFGEASVGVRRRAQVRPRP